MISSPVMVATRQPWRVQVALKALKVPLVGWVTTTFSPLRMTPLPTGTSAGATGAPPAAPPALLPLDDPSPPDEDAALSLPQPARTVAAPPPRTPRTVRRLRSEVVTVALPAGWLASVEGPGRSLLQPYRPELRRGGPRRCPTVLRPPGAARPPVSS